MKIKPIGNRILVKLIPEEKKEQKTAGGIYLPEDTAERSKYRKGSVVEVGDVKELSSGDMVLLDHFGGTEIEVDGEPHVILVEKDVLAKVV